MAELEGGRGARELPSAAELDRSARETADPRRLPVGRASETRFLTRQEATARIVADIEEEYRAATAEAEARVLAAFGLVPAGTDLCAAHVRYFERGVAGFYDPEADALSVIDEAGRLDAGAALTHSYEAVHALQDAHLGLDALGRDSGERLTDSGLAVAAMVEGDATVAGFEHLSANPEWFEQDDGRGAFLEQLLGMGAAAATPAARGTPAAEPILPILAATFLFPYS